MFRIAAIGIQLVFYGVYFGKKIRQKKQGTQTNLLGRGKTGFVLFVELSLKILTFAILVADAIAIVQNVSSEPLFVRIPGLLLGITGDVVFLFAVITMGDSWRAGVPNREKTQLVTDGIYRYSRNPAFLGFDLVYIGTLLMFFSRWLLVITALTVLMFHLQIVNVEEDYLLVTFGEEYRSYRKQVNRYFGRKR